MRSLARRFYFAAFCLLEGCQLATLRFWRQSDLPDLMRMAAVTAWEITPEDDRSHTTPEIVGRNAQQNLLGALRSPYGTAIVADDNGRAVGFLLIGIQFHQRSGVPHGYMADIYVEPAYRGQRLGKGMHLMAEEYLRRIGLKRASNWTHAHNKLGQEVSHHHGFRLWGLMLSKDLQTPVHKEAGR